MPFAMVERELANGSLVEIKLQDAETDGFVMPMYATYRTDLPPGPAGRWLIEQFKVSEAAQTEAKSYETTVNSL